MPTRGDLEIISIALLDLVELFLRIEVTNVRAEDDYDWKPDAWAFVDERPEAERLANPVYSGVGIGTLEDFRSDPLNLIWSNIAPGQRNRFSGGLRLGFHSRD